MKVRREAGRWGVTALNGAGCVLIDWRTRACAPYSPVCRPMPPSVNDLTRVCWNCMGCRKMSVISAPDETGASELRWHAASSLRAHASMPFAAPECDVQGHSPEAAPSCPYPLPPIPALPQAFFAALFWDGPSSLQWPALDPSPRMLYAAVAGLSASFG